MPEVEADAIVLADAEFRYAERRLDPLRKRLKCGRCGKKRSDLQLVVEVHEGLSHMAPLTRPKDVAASIVAHLARAEAPAPPR